MHALKDLDVIQGYGMCACARELTARYPHLRSSNQVAVISPYSAQVRRCLLCRRCSALISTASSITKKNADARNLQGSKVSVHWLGGR